MLIRSNEQNSRQVLSWFIYIRLL